MYAVEFQAKVQEDGSIEIPAVYRTQVQGVVRVIILAERATTAPSMIYDLLAHPREITGFVPFSRAESHDPDL